MLDKSPILPMHIWSLQAHKQALGKLVRDWGTLFLAP